MENLSDDDFRAYMNDFQSYLHNISDLGPIEPSSVEVVNAIASPSDADESSINWSAMNNGQGHGTTGAEVDEQRPDVEEEDDEDRIVAEGCDLDCSKEPDLIPNQKHSGWFPDAHVDVDDGLRPVLTAEDIAAGSEVDPEVKPVEEETNEESSNSAEECQKEADNDHDLGRSEVEKNVEQAEEVGETGDSEIYEEEHSLYDQKSPELGTDFAWRYYGEDNSQKEAKMFSEKQAKEACFKAIEEEVYSPLETNKQLQQDEEVLVDFEDTNPRLHETPSWQNQVFRDEASSKGEEIRLQSEEEEFVRDRNQTGASAGAGSPEEQQYKTSDATAAAGSEMEISCSTYQPCAESSHRTTDDFKVPSESSTFQASEQGLQEDFEEERAYVEEQEASYSAENVCLMTSSADEENRNTLIGYGEETETGSDVKQSQNGSQLKIYPSQVRKTDKFFLSGESQSPNGDAGAPTDVLSPGENGNEEEERELPEQGSVKSLLAQWRQIEQQKKKPRGGGGGGAKEEEEVEHQKLRQPLSFGWSHEPLEEEDEMQPPRSRVRDEILRMRSQSCDPMASRKHNRLSPNDDDVPSVGKRIGRGRSRMEETDEAEDADQYRSQPSLTKAILAKFENLDLQAANSAIKPKSNKNFKWQVKETTRFCRPGFVPRSGR